MNNFRKRRNVCVFVLTFWNVCCVFFVAGGLLLLFVLFMFVMRR